MILNDFLEALIGLPADAPLIFSTEDGEIGAGYHITEFKIAQVTSIDCGANLDSWAEAALQLLDGEGGSHMTNGKFAGILAASINRVAGLGDVPVHVEFAHKNQGMRQFQLGVPVRNGTAIHVALSDNRAHCKPAKAAKRATGVIAKPETSGCCGAKPNAAACCA